MTGQDRQPDALHCDALILGGGVAGLWTLDALTRAGHAALLLEAHALGSPQSVCAQGILHSGIKYTLGGMLTGAASNIGDVPAHWRDCLAGRAIDGPDLSRVHVRDHGCFMWRTRSLSSVGAMVGARAGLKSKPTKVPRDQRPTPLRDCPGDVFRVDETVLDPAGVLRELAALHPGRVGAYDADSLTAERDADGWRMRLNPSSAGGSGPAQSGRCGQATDPQPATTRTLHARRVVLTAGAGNAALRERFSLPTQDTMQTRPLHMAMARGPDLPELNGHCVDGLATRVTITSDRDAQGRVVWQLGGQLAERGVEQDEATLIAHAQREVAAVLPGAELGDVQWATYRVDRAEGRSADGKRPDDVVLRDEDAVLTAWPTKLVLAPKLAAAVRDALPKPIGITATLPNDWPTPAVASPPWAWEAVAWHD